MAELGNLKNLDDEKNDNVVVTNYQDFRKIVCAFIKEMHYYIKTDEDVEKYIKEGGGDGIIRVMYNENKENFAQGKYVYSKAGACAMNLD